MCVWQVKLCDPIVTHGPYLSALEMRHDKSAIQIHVTLVYSTFADRQTGRTNPETTDIKRK